MFFSCNNCSNFCVNYGAASKYTTGSAYFFSFFFDENEIGRARIYFFFFFFYVFFFFFSRHSQPCQIIQGGFITVAAIESCSLGYKFFRSSMLL